MPPSFGVAIRCLLFLICCPVLAQVTIINPHQLEVPEQRVQAIFQATREVVAREFQKSEKEIDFALVLVLGDPYEQYTADEKRHLYTLYLHRWDEVKFATSALRLAIQHMVSHRQRDQLVREILDRSKRIGQSPFMICKSVNDAIFRIS